MTFFDFVIFGFKLTVVHCLGTQGQGFNRPRFRSQIRTLGSVSKSSKSSFSDPVQLVAGTEEREAGRVESTEPRALQGRRSKESECSFDRCHQVNEPTIKNTTLAAPQ